MKNPSDGVIISILYVFAHFSTLLLLGKNISLSNVILSKMLQLSILSDISRTMSLNPFLPFVKKYNVHVSNLQCHLPFFKGFQCKLITDFSFTLR